jgi:hypothetical protein
VTSTTATTRPSTHATKTLDRKGIIMRLFTLPLASLLPFVTIGLVARDAGATAPSDPELCTRPAESDGVAVCLAEGGGDPWIDDGWYQSGPDTWANAADGTYSTWVETAPDEYEIFDSQPAAQQGATVPLPPSPAPPVTPPPPGGDDPTSPLPPLPSSPPLSVTVGDYTMDSSQWANGSGLGVVTGRAGPYGVTRMVAAPPTSLQFAELEFVWAVHKANATEPYRRVGVVIDDFQISVNPPAEPEPEPGHFYSFDELLVHFGDRIKGTGLLDVDPETACLPRCGPIWDGIFVITEMIEYPFEFVSGGIFPPEGDLTLEWLIDTAGNVLEHLDALDLEHFVAHYLTLVDLPALYCDPDGNCSEGDVSAGTKLGRAMLWFLDLVDPRQAERLTAGEELYRETIVTFLSAVSRDALLLVLAGELTAEQAASAIMALGLRYHGALVAPPLMPGFVSARELGGLRPTADALYVGR